MVQREVIVRFTIEVLGSPKEHVEKTLSDALATLQKEKGVRFIKKEVYVTEQMESSGMWSTFADVEFAVEDVQRLFHLCYDYMPAQIEVLEPLGLQFESLHMQEFLNDVLSKLHKYAMLLKKLQGENIHMLHLLKTQGKK